MRASIHLSSKPSRGSPSSGGGSTLRPLIDWNPPLAIALITLLSAQLFKFASNAARGGGWDFTRLSGMGGMPSAHAASVCALSTAVGLSAGFDSTVFGAVAFFSGLIVYDAAGIRQAAGRQARLLNRMLDDLRAHHSVQGERLIELLGHTALEVFVGAAYGIALALMLYP